MPLSIHDLPLISTLTSTLCSVGSKLTQFNDGSSITITEEILELHGFLSLLPTLLDVMVCVSMILLPITSSTSQIEETDP